MSRNVSAFETILRPKPLAKASANKIISTVYVVHSVTSVMPQQQQQRQHHQQQFIYKYTYSQYITTSTNEHTHTHTYSYKSTEIEQKYGEYDAKIREKQITSHKNRHKEVRKKKCVKSFSTANNVVFYLQIINGSLEYLKWQRHYTIAKLEQYHRRIEWERESVCVRASVREGSRGQG